MTTTFGIKTNKGEEAVVLASDTQISLYEEGLFTKKEENVSKMKIGKNHAATFAGTFEDKYLNVFFDYLNGNRDFESFFKTIILKKDAGLRNSIFSNYLSKAVKKRYG